MARKVGQIIVGVWSETEVFATRERRTRAIYVCGSQRRRPKDGGNHHQPSGWFWSVGHLTHRVFNARLLSLILRPWRGYACHARVSDELSHVLVAMNDEAEVNGVCGSISLQELDFPLQILGRFCGPGCLRGL